MQRTVRLTLRKVVSDTLFGSIIILTYYSCANIVWNTEYAPSTQ